MAVRIVYPGYVIGRIIREGLRSAESINDLYKAQLVIINMRRRIAERVGECRLPGAVAESGGKTSPIALLNDPTVAIVRIGNQQCAPLVINLGNSVACIICISLRAASRVCASDKITDRVIGVNDDLPSGVGDACQKVFRIRKIYGAADRIDDLNKIASAVIGKGQPVPVFVDDVGQSAAWAKLQLRLTLIRKDVGTVTDLDQ